TSAIVLLVSMAVFWIRGKASGSLIPSRVMRSPFARSTSLRDSSFRLSASFSMRAASRSRKRETATSSAGASSAGLSGLTRKTKTPASTARAATSGCALLRSRTEVGGGAGAVLANEPHGTLDATSIAHHDTPLRADGLSHGRPRRGVIIDDQNSPSLGFHASLHEQGKCHFA